MNIGIDIDHTITDIQACLNEAVIKYAKSLGKTVDRSDLVLDDKYNDGSVYRETFGFTEEELRYFLTDIQESITEHALPRNHVVDVLKNWRSQGNKIIIITARDYEYHDDPYLQSKNWLERHQIPYDKLIVNARNKKSVCKEEHINLLIDDNLTNCLNVQSIGIKAIRICSKDEIDQRITSCENWLDIENLYHNDKNIYKIKK